MQFLPKGATRRIEEPEPGNCPVLGIRPLAWGGETGGRRTSRPPFGHVRCNDRSMVAGGAVACATDQHELGEGARWDARRDEFLRIDILAGRVYRDTIDNEGRPRPRSHVPARRDGRVARAGQGRRGLAGLRRAGLRLPVARRRGSSDRRGRAGRHTDERRRMRPARPVLGRHVARITARAAARCTGSAGTGRPR